MNELQLFNFNGQEVRTLLIDEEPYFVGKDVASVLGYKKTADAIRKHVRTKHKGVYELETPGWSQEMTIISEPGLYSLIMKSKAPQAEQFQDWVTEEVLPTIRKHGAYVTEQTLEQMLADPQTMITTLERLKEEQDKRKALELENQRMKPKEIFADAVASSKTSILVGELAKLLKQNGVNTGQKRLFEWLRENGYLIKRKGTDYNMPTQKSMEMGLFEIKETSITKPDGHTQISKTPKVTGKGQQYFINKLLEV